MILTIMCLHGLLKIWLPHERGVEARGLAIFGGAIELGVALAVAVAVVGFLVLVAINIVVLAREEPARLAQEEEYARDVADYARVVRARRAPEIQDALAQRYPGRKVNLRGDGSWELMDIESGSVATELTWREALDALGFLRRR